MIVGGGSYPVSTVANATWVEDEYAPTLAQITFILSQAPVDSLSLSFLVNGVRTDESVDWTRSGQTITWLNTYTLVVGDVVHAHYK